MEASNRINKESPSQQAAGYSLSLQMGTNENSSKLRGIRPIWSNQIGIISTIIIASIII